MAKILLVEDNADLVTALIDWLTHEHFTVEVASNGRTGMDLMTCAEYDLMILDWDLPDINGIELCRQFRRQGGKTPIIMLTGKSAIAEKEEGLDSGADDYLTKPFNMRELSARIRAMMRRNSGQSSNTLRAGNLTLDPHKYKVLKDGVDIHLLPKEFALLELLMRNPDTVFSAESIIQRVWISDSEATPEAVRTCIRRLRQKIEDDGAQPLIETLHRVGYRLRQDPKGTGENP
jgi:DNA-binding response OmpR family regulator